MPARVIERATGDAGILALEAVAASPDLELVGARVSDEGMRRRAADGDH